MVSSGLPSSPNSGSVLSRVMMFEEKHAPNPSPVTPTKTLYSGKYAPSMPSAAETWNGRRTGLGGPAIVGDGGTRETITVPLPAQQQESGDDGAHPPNKLPVHVGADTKTFTPTAGNWRARAQRFKQNPPPYLSKLGGDNFSRGGDDVGGRTNDGAQHPSTASSSGSSTQPAEAQQDEGADASTQSNSLRYSSSLSSEGAGTAPPAVHGQHKQQPSSYTFGGSQSRQQQEHPAPRQEQQQQNQGVSPSPTNGSWRKAQSPGSAIASGRTTPTTSTASTDQEEYAPPSNAAQRNSEVSPPRSRAADLDPEQSSSSASYSATSAAAAARNARAARLRRTRGAGGSLSPRRKSAGVSTAEDESSNPKPQPQPQSNPRVVGGRLHRHNTLTMQRHSRQPLAPSDGRGISGDEGSARSESSAVRRGIGGSMSPTSTAGASSQSSGGAGPGTIVSEPGKIGAGSGTGVGSSGPEWMTARSRILKSRTVGGGRDDDDEEEELVNANSGVPSAADRRFARINRLRQRNSANAGTAGSTNAGNMDKDKDTDNDKFAEGEKERDRAETPGGVGTGGALSPTSSIGGAVTPVSHYSSHSSRTGMISVSSSVITTPTSNVTRHESDPLPASEPIPSAAARTTRRERLASQLQRQHKQKMRPNHLLITQSQEGDDEDGVDGNRQQHRKLPEQPVQQFGNPSETIKASLVVKDADAREQEGSTAQVHVEKNDTSEMSHAPFPTEATRPVTRAALLERKRASLGQRHVSTAAPQTKSRSNPVSFGMLPHANAEEDRNSKDAAVTAAPPPPPPPLPPPPPSQPPPKPQVASQGDFRTGMALAHVSSEDEFSLDNASAKESPLRIPSAVAPRHLRYQQQHRPRPASALSTPPVQIGGGHVGVGLRESPARMGGRVGIIDGSPQPHASSESVNSSDLLDEAFSAIDPQRKAEEDRVLDDAFTSVQDRRSGEDEDENIFNEAFSAVVTNPGQYQQRQTVARIDEEEEEKENEVQDEGNANQEAVERDVQFGVEGASRDQWTFQGSTLNDASSFVPPHQLHRSQGHQARPQIDTKHEDRRQQQQLRFIKKHEDDSSSSDEGEDTQYFSSRDDEVNNKEEFGQEEVLEVEVEGHDNEDGDSQQVFKVTRTRQKITMEDEEISTIPIADGGGGRSMKKSEGKMRRRVIRMEGRITPTVTPQEQQRLRQKEKMRHEKESGELQEVHEKLDEQDEEENKKIQSENNEIVGQAFSQVRRFDTLPREASPTLRTAPPTDTSVLSFLTPAPAPSPGSPNRSIDSQEKQWQQQQMDAQTQGDDESNLWSGISSQGSVQQGSFAVRSVASSQRSTRHRSVRSYADKSQTASSVKSHSAGFARHEQEERSQLAHINSHNADSQSIPVADADEEVTLTTHDVSVFEPVQEEEYSETDEDEIQRQQPLQHEEEVQELAIDQQSHQMTVSENNELDVVSDAEERGYEEDIANEGGMDASLDSEGLNGSIGAFAMDDDAATQQTEAAESAQSNQEALAAWWQDRYASSYQNEHEVNSVVQEALSPRHGMYEGQGPWLQSQKEVEASIAEADEEVEDVESYQGETGDDPYPDVNEETQEGLNETAQEENTQNAKTANFTSMDGDDVVSFSTYESDAPLNIYENPVLEDGFTRDAAANHVSVDHRQVVETQQDDFEDDKSSIFSGIYDSEVESEPASSPKRDAMKLTSESAATSSGGVGMDAQSNENGGVWKTLSRATPGETMCDSSHSLRSDDTSEAFSHSTHRETTPNSSQSMKSHDTSEAFSHSTHREAIPNSSRSTNSHEMSEPFNRSTYRETFPNSSRSTTSHEMSEAFSHSTHRDTIPNSSRSTKSHETSDASRHSIHLETNPNSGHSIKSSEAHSHSTHRQTIANSSRSIKSYGMAETFSHSTPQETMPDPNRSLKSYDMSEASSHSTLRDILPDSSRSLRSRLSSEAISQSTTNETMPESRRSVSSRESYTERQEQPSSILRSKKEEGTKHSSQASEKIDAYSSTEDSKRKASEFDAIDDGTVDTATVDTATIEESGTIDGGIAGTSTMDGATVDTGTLDDYTYQSETDTVGTDDVQESRAASKVTFKSDDDTFTYDPQRSWTGQKREKEREKSFFEHFGCGVLDSFAALCERKDATEGNSSRKGKKDVNGEESLSPSDMENEHNAEGTPQQKSYSSLGSDMLDATESSSTPGLNMNLSEKEKKVWDEWDRKDEGLSVLEGTSTSITRKLPTIQPSHQTPVVLSKVEELEEQQRKAEHLERRARAHEKLLTLAYSALSVPNRTDVDADKNILEERSENETSTTNEDIEIDASESKACDANVEEQPTTHPNEGDNKNAGPVSPRSSLAGQRQLLERFCSKLRSEGMEVLKVNRDRKWQTRFLTVSKEVTWLNTDENEGCGDRAHVPQGLLWMKKFSAKSKEHTVKNIDRQGKGGMYFHHLANIEEVVDGGNDKLVAPLTKKQQQGKFKESVIVKLRGEAHGASREVIVRCLSKEDALVLISGCNIIVKMLKIDFNLRKISSEVPSPSSPSTTSSSLSPRQSSSNKKKGSPRRNKKRSSSPQKSKLGSKRGGGYSPGVSSTKSTPKSSPVKHAETEESDSDLWEV